MIERTIIDIERRSSSLIGKAITSIYKDKDSLYLEFTSGEEFEYLIIMGFFRVILDGEIILSSNDLSETSEFEEPEKTLVTEVDVGYFGDITLLFDNGARLEVISNTSYDESMWNLAEGNEEFTSYFVVTPYAAGRIRKNKSNKEQSMKDERPKTGANASEFSAGKSSMRNSKHALLSASSAHRWLECTPSARLSETVETVPDSSYAIEGMLAHEVAEGKLMVALGIEGTAVATAKDSDMDEHTDAYVAFVLGEWEKAQQTSEDPTLLIEERLDYSKYASEGFGTVDCVIADDETLHVIDFKYGQGLLVESEDNPQMKLYALGALELFDGISDDTEVKMTIYQPRRDNISTTAMMAVELKKWGENVVSPKAALAFHGKGEFKPGAYCRFCKAKTKCSAYASDRSKKKTNPAA